ncbi:MAG: nucleotidyltransferase family protein [Hadesarchaea archaeon]|nr:nucleotidyltransferase family protein [Hadesarchaea archaeon]
MVGVVILAAGESQRMGEPKLLMEIKGKRMIEWVIDSFSGAVDDLVVVLGHKPENLIPTLEKLGTRWTVNKNYREGMVSSFKEGLKKLKDHDAVFLALGDQPFVDQDFLVKAIDVWKTGAKIVSPVFKGKKGHPVLFDRSLFDEILLLQKHEMIRDVTHRHDSEHYLIEAGEWAVIDLDTPESFEKFFGKKL